MTGHAKKGAVWTSSIKDGDDLGSMRGFGFGRAVLQALRGTAAWLHCLGEAANRSRTPKQVADLDCKGDTSAA
jgi:hypothetical protein